MKKRIFCLILALSLLAVSARAAENSMGNFVRDSRRAYTGQFADVPKTHTFYNSIAALCELGLTQGKADGAFGLTDNVTVSQMVISAGRVRSLYRTGDPEAGAAAHPGAGAACMPYLRYLQAEGLVGHELDGVLFTPATRAQAAHLLANLLPESALPAINREAVTEAYARRALLPDVDAYTPYQADILRLYHCGISQGSDEKGSFLPDRPITRGAAAAMLARLADPALRIKIAKKAADIPDVSGKTLSNIVSPGRYYPTPSTAKELDATVRYMLYLGNDRLRLHYPDLTVRQSRELMQEMLAVVKTYCEQGYNTVTADVDPEGIDLIFYAGGAKEQTAAYRAATLQAAKEVHDRLWAEGYLTADMTDYDKALVYYLWICANCDYDQTADADSVSHIPYSLFAYGAAVCDGYTGAYNLLLKLEGIDCRAYLTEEHIWTVAALDGKEIHIDATWGDAAGGSLLYFAMPPETSLLLHGVS